MVEDRTRGQWTLVCNLGGHIFVRQIGAKTGRAVRPRLDLCTRVFRDQPPNDEIPRPLGFAPVPVLSSRPTPGGAEVVGKAGVAAGQPDSGGRLLNFVSSEGPKLDLSDSPINEGEADLGQAYIEDAAQAAKLGGAEIRELPLPGGSTPQP